MTTHKLEDLFALSEEEWDSMTTAEKTLFLRRFEEELEKRGFLLEYDEVHGKPHNTLQ